MMIVGYSDTNPKSTTADKIRDCLRECLRNHGCTPVEIQCNQEDIGVLTEVDGVPLTTIGRLVANRNMFFLKLPTAE
jgi:hypothetical protein